MVLNPSYGLEWVVPSPSFNQNPNKVPGHGPDLAQRQSHEEMTMKEEIGKVLLHLVMSSK